MLAKVPICQSDGYYVTCYLFVYSKQKKNYIDKLYFIYNESKRKYCTIVIRQYCKDKISFSDLDFLKS